MIRIETGEYRPWMIIVHQNECCNTVNLSILSSIIILFFIYNVVAVLIFILFGINSEVALGCFFLVFLAIIYHKISQVRYRVDFYQFVSYKKLMSQWYSGVYHDFWPTWCGGDTVSVHHFWDGEYGYTLPDPYSPAQY